MQLNMTATSTMMVPRGYPVRLLPALDPMLTGVITSAVTTVTALVQTEAGTANVHLALYTMPTTSNGVDGPLVAKTDIVGLTSVQQSIAVTIPSGLPATCYIVRLFVDGITGSNTETVSRDGSTAVASEPKVPTGVLVSSVTVS